MNSVNPNPGPNPLGGAGLVKSPLIKTGGPQGPSRLPPGALDKGPEPRNLANVRLCDGWETFASTRADGKRYDLTGKGAAPPAEAQAQAKAPGGGVAAEQGPARPQHAPAGEKPAAEAEKAAPERTARQAPPARETGQPQTGTASAREPAATRDATPGPSLPAFTEWAQPQPSTLAAQQAPPSAPPPPGAEAAAPQSQPAPAPPQPSSAPAPTLPTAAPREAAPPPPAASGGAVAPTVAPPPPEAAGRALQGPDVRNQSPLGYLSRPQVVREERTTREQEEDPAPRTARAKQEERSLEGLRSRREEPLVEERRPDEEASGSSRRCPQCSVDLPDRDQGACPRCRVGAPDVLHLAALHYRPRGERVTVRSARSEIYRKPSAPIVREAVPRLPARQDVLVRRLAG